MDPRLVAFIGVSAVLTVLPGADTALVTRTAVADGRRAAWYATLGILCGVMTHATLSALGISAVLARSAAAFTALKLIGAAYLVYLGARILIDATRGKEPSTPEPAGHAVGADAASAWRRGFLTNLLNPKVALFYLTFLPQFMAPGDSVLARSLLLAAIHNVMGLVWLTTVAWFFGRLGAALARPVVKRRLEQLTGAVLVAVGLRLAWSRQ